MILNDKQIREFVVNGGIENAEIGQVAQINGHKALSYGVSSAGYDFRMQGQYFVPKNTSRVYDVKARQDKAFWREIQAREDTHGRGIIIPPYCTALARTMETVHLPNNIMILMTCKSTYARAGISMPFTPIEPGFDGTITLEITNTQPFPIMVYEGEGIAQGIFMLLEPCETGYRDRNNGQGGKYHQQHDTTFGRV